MTKNVLIKNSKIQLKITHQLLLSKTFLIINESNYQAKKVEKNRCN